MMILLAHKSLKENYSIRNKKLSLSKRRKPNQRNLTMSIMATTVMDMVMDMGEIKYFTEHQ